MGTDKYKLPFHGKAQYQHLAELISQLGIAVHISSSQQQIGDISGEFNVIPDEYHAIGPMGGILSAMKYLPHSPWLVIACDLPFVTTKTIESLVSKRNSEADVTTFQLNERFFETTFAIYEPSSYRWVEQFRLQENYRLQAAFKTMKLHVLQPENHRDFMNINTTTDLEKFKKIKASEK